MTQTQQPQRTLRPFIQTLKPGTPMGQRNLPLVPLEGEGHERLDYILAADAIAAAMLTVPSPRMWPPLPSRRQRWPCTMWWSKGVTRSPVTSRRCVTRPAVVASSSPLTAGLSLWTCSTSRPR